MGRQPAPQAALATKYKEELFDTFGVVPGALAAGHCKRADCPVVGLGYNLWLVKKNARVDLSQFHFQEGNDEN